VTLLVTSLVCVGVGVLGLVWANDFGIDHRSTGNFAVRQDQQDPHQRGRRLRVGAGLAHHALVLQLYEAEPDLPEPWPAPWWAVSDCGERAALNGPVSGDHRWRHPGRCRRGRRTQVGDRADSAWNSCSQLANFLASAPSSLQRAVSRSSFRIPTPSSSQASGVPARQRSVGVARQPAQQNPTTGDLHHGHRPTTRVSIPPTPHTSSATCELHVAECAMSRRGAAPEVVGCRPCAAERRLCS
jgi:hypothetical protein